jgi:hypothetical protein
MGNAIHHPEQLTVQKIQTFKPSAVMELFATLSAPDFKEMQGEFKANLGNHGSFLKNLIAEFSTQLSFFNGVWLCKCFEPLTDITGHGYNSFRKSGRVIRKFPMKTSIAKSIYDGRDVFQLDYTAYKTLLGSINMVDEIRKVRDNLYLGIGSTGLTRKHRFWPMSFTLSGPADPFLGTDKPYLPS